MDNMFRYLNTDLVIACSQDLTDLADAFDAGGARPLYLTKGDDGTWYASFETGEDHDGPESNISRMLAIVDSLTGPPRDLWMSCTMREFNIGYDCGAEPWAFNDGLSADLLGRIAGAKASLRITLYPHRDEAVFDKPPS